MYVNKSQLKLINTINTWIGTPLLSLVTCQQAGSSQRCFSPVGIFGTKDKYKGGAKFVVEGV